MYNTMLSAQASGITFNTCIGCIGRGVCQYESYMTPGDYCRSKVTDNDLEKIEKEFDDADI